MDAKRLEELAAWAEANADWFANMGATKMEATHRDLARCAAAWAKVERELDRQAGYSIDLWKHRGVVHILTNQQSIKADTAIEAVEAAKEETNAK